MPWQETGSEKESISKSFPGLMKAECPSEYVDLFQLASEHIRMRG